MRISNSRDGHGSGLGRLSCARSSQRFRLLSPVYLPYTLHNLHHRKPWILNPKPAGGLLCEHYVCIYEGVCSYSIRSAIGSCFSLYSHQKILVLLFDLGIRMKVTKKQAKKTPSRHDLMRWGGKNMENSCYYVAYPIFLLPYRIVLLLCDIVVEIWGGILWCWELKYSGAKLSSNIVVGSIYSGKFSSNIM